MTGPATSRRSRGGAALSWLQQEGGGDAGALGHESLRALAGPPQGDEQVSQVPCGHIDRSPYQARRVFPAAALAELRESVRQNGLLQPVVIRPRPGGRYELIAGERRWRVVQQLGWETVEAVVRVVDDITAHLLGQIENDTREDVSAWERALGYVDLRAHIARERGAAPQLVELGQMRGGVDKSTVSRYLTIGDAFPPETAARAGVSEEEMASLSLPTLLRAARKPEAHRFTLLRDVLRKRRARAANRASRSGASRSDAGLDERPPSTDPGPDRVGPEAAGGPESALHGWERYFLDRGIRMETMVPARELTARQARAAAVRMVPALAALAARAAGVDRPAPLALQGPGGKVVFLPDALDAEHTAAWETFRAAIGL
ncbi:MAG TPA: ParB/RepB/Spo0J family partition protein [Longimicrobium sp.]